MITTAVNKNKYLDTCIYNTWSLPNEPQLYQMSCSCKKTAFISIITETNRKLKSVTNINKSVEQSILTELGKNCFYCFTYCNKWAKGTSMFSLCQVTMAGWYSPNHLLSYTCDWKSLSVGYMLAQVSHYHLAHESNYKPLPQGHPGPTNSPPHLPPPFNKHW